MDMDMDMDKLTASMEDIFVPVEGYLSNSTNLSFQSTFFLYKISYIP